MVNYRGKRELELTLQWGCLPHAPEVFFQGLGDKSHSTPVSPWSRLIPSQNPGFAFNTDHASLPSSTILCFATATIRGVQVEEHGDFDMWNWLAQLFKYCLPHLAASFGGASVKTREFEIHARTTAEVVTLMRTLRDLSPDPPLPPSQKDDSILHTVQAEEPMTVKG